MINRVFADETFELEVDAYASKLASKSASAVALSKRLLYQMDTMSFEAALEAGIEVNAIARMTEDYKLGVAKFVKKTLVAGTLRTPSCPRPAGCTPPIARSRSPSACRADR